MISDTSVLSKCSNTGSVFRSMLSRDDMHSLTDQFGLRFSKSKEILNIFIFVAEVIVECQCSPDFGGESGYCYKPGKESCHGIHNFPLQNICLQ